MAKRTKPATMLAARIFGLVTTLARNTEETLAINTMPVIASPLYLIWGQLTKRNK